jgi:hypothetical protein
MMGQEWAAEPWVNLLRESSKRLDDPLEVEKFIPEVPPEVAQAMGGNQPSEQEEAETAKTEAETDAKKADTIKTLAEALEINPLFAGPAMQMNLESYNEYTSRKIGRTASRRSRYRRGTASQR